MAEEALEAIPAEIVEEAEGFMNWLCKGEQKKHAHRLAQEMPMNASLELLRLGCQKIRFGLSEQAFIVCDSFKRMWRYAHPEISTWWRELEDCTRAAIAQPNFKVTCRRVTLLRTGAWLRIVLPSGRALCYPSPQVNDKGEISYMGINQYSRKWSRLGTYGGKLAENITQAVARDVLVENFPAIEAAGYEMVLTVHDEDITEAPDLPEYNSDALAAIMSTNPKWAKGLPLAAAGFDSYRYKKG
jgi:DNA polymerase